MSQPGQPDAAGGGPAADMNKTDTTLRQARASGRLRMQAETLRKIREREVPGGDVLEVARLAGILAAKRTAELIPLCQPPPLDAIEVAFHILDDTTITLEAISRATARNGVEMQSLVAVTLAALTVYQMCEPFDRAIVVEQVRLEEESGGTAGHFVRPT